MLIMQKKPISSFKTQNKFRFVGKVEKVLLRLGDFERLFYKGFSGKNDDCSILCHYHRDRGYVA